LTDRVEHYGFTLFEVVLAVSLTVGLVTGMFALYSQSMKTRDYVNKEMDMLLSNRLAMEHITRELRTGMQLQFPKMGMEGSSGEAEWVSAQIPGPEAWGRRTILKNAPPSETDIQIVGYRLRMSTNEQGRTVIDGLERTCQKILAPILPEEDEKNEDKTNESGYTFTIDRRAAIEVTFLTPHVKYLRFRYWDGNGWLGSWTGGDLPGAVEITLGPTILPENPLEDFDDEFFRRVVFIPTGVKKLTAPSGLESSEGSRL